MWSQRLMWTMWPAFLVAAMLEIVVFAFVDPSDLHWFGSPLAISREAVYTLAFFVFWVAAMVASALTALLTLSPFEVNRCPIPVDERPSDCAKNKSCG